MASWTDVNPPQFTPYRQQLPVDAMVSVGLQKQAQYQEGVERIQSEIDRVAGMDVVRDIDRRYLQSKVNEIGNNTKLAAASDFSNFQLVNSLAGMVNNVAKDKNIINAVSSTAKYRKEISRMDKAREEGKSSVANEAYFGYKANDWLSSQDLNRGFDAQYMEKIDVDKKWMDVLKSLHSDLDETDNPYVTNPDGTIDYMQTAAAMQRMSSERVSSSKIENALRASLSPDELQQLNINGWYQFRDATPEQLVVQSKRKFDSAIQVNLDRIRELEGLANFTDDPQLKMNATNSIASLRSMNMSLRKDYDDEIKWVQQNPDLAKGLIYKNGAIAQFAQAHSWEHSKTNLLSNPVLQAQFEQERINLSRASFALDQDKFTWSKIMDEKNYNLQYAKILAEQNPVEPVTSKTYFGTETDLPTPLTSTNEKIQILSDQSDVLTQRLLEKIPELDAVQLENAKIAYINGDAEGIKKADSYIKGAARTAFLQLLQVDKDKRVLNTSINETRKEVLNSPKYAARREALNQKQDEIGGISFRAPDGGFIIFTPEEIENYLLKTKREEKRSGSGQFASTSIETSIISPLSEKEQILYANRNTVASKLREHQTATKDFINDVQKEVEVKYAERASSFIPVGLNIPTPNAEARNDLEVFAGGAVSKFNDPLGGTRGGSAEISPADVETVNTWLMGSDKANLQYQPIIIPGTGKAFMNVKNGNENVLIPLNPEEVVDLPVNLGQLVSPDYIRLMEAQTSGKGKTNSTGKFEDAYFDRTDIPNVTLNLKADMEQDFTNPDIQFINLRLRTPQGDVDLTLDQRYLTAPDGRHISPTNAMSFIRGLTDKQVFDLYMQHPDVSPNQKKIIQGLIQQK